jgi:MFS transporter, FHS family, glucose/mannose:H+ symporter
MPRISAGHRRKPRGNSRNLKINPTDTSKCNSCASLKCFITQHPAAERSHFWKTAHPRSYGFRENWGYNNSLMSSVAQLQLDPDGEKSAARDAWRSMAAFLVSGMLMSFLGAILPAWRYHLRPSFTEVGDYFLSLAFGLLLSVGTAHFLLPRRGLKFVLVLANLLACGGFLFLALSSPPVAAAWRLGGVLCIGFSTGLLNAAVFHAISPMYQIDRAATVNFAGLLFGSGSLLTALLVAGTYYVYTVPSILILFAALPGLYAVVCYKGNFSRHPNLQTLPLAQVLRDFQNPGAVLFSLLLFFQFGNEWSMAGWLPLFLIRRLGISPEDSLLLLALYWASLLVGRIISQFILKRVNRALLLIGSIVSALLGMLVLASTNNVFGAVMGILFVGAGFASIYPLVVEKIAHRFPYYHPGFYNGLFSLAMTGGFLAPWLLGYFAQAWGIQAVMILPLAGTFMVFLLVLLIMLESKLSSLSQLTRAGS